MIRLDNPISWKRKNQAPITSDEVSTQHLGGAPSFCGRSRSVWTAGIFAIHGISHPHVYQHIHIHCILYTYSLPYVCTMWGPLPRRQQRSNVTFPVISDSYSVPRMSNAPDTNSIFPRACGWRLVLTLFHFPSSDATSLTVWIPCKRWKKCPAIKAMDFKYLCWHIFRLSREKREDMVL